MHKIKKGESFLNPTKAGGGKCWSSCASLSQFNVFLATSL